MSLNRRWQAANQSSSLPLILSVARRLPLWRKLPSPDVQRPLSERPRVDFLARMDLNMDCQQANRLLPMEIVPAALPKRIARAIVRGCGLLCGIACCLVEYLLRRLHGKLSEQARIEVLHRWSRWTLPRMAIRVEVAGSPAGAGLIASNHLSYLDILVYSAIAPCAFVAKREVRAWPAVGWIATLAGTIYVDRSRRSETHTIQPEIQSALAAGLRLFLFPEGTSSNGSCVLPFHSSLFQPAVDLQVPVSAASIEYTIPDGIAGTEACYFGTMKLFPHLMNLLGKHSITAKVNFSPDSFLFSDRKQASLTMHQEVERLRFSRAEVTQ
jgi:1-acyl-sn-glycerol-3-phosphate acyltransferase